MTDQNETNDEFEARMIAQFNERANQSETSPNLAVETKRNKDLQGSLLSEKKVSEKGGPKGLEPTRYGDWEAKGRCHDF